MPGTDEFRKPISLSRERLPIVATILLEAAGWPRRRSAGTDEAETNDRDRVELNMADSEGRPGDGSLFRSSVIGAC